MNTLPRPPLKLSKTALSELKTILEQDIGKDALHQLSEAQINHIGCFLLTLTAIQLDIRIREHQSDIDNT